MRDGACSGWGIVSFQLSRSLRTKVYFVHSFPSEQAMLTGAVSCVVQSQGKSILLVKNSGTGALSDLRFLLQATLPTVVMGDFAGLQQLLP